MTVEDLKTALKSEKMTIGAKEVVRKLKHGQVKKVFVAATCPETVRTIVKRYAALKKIEVVELAVPSSEVALLCKKNYPISILSC